MRRVLTCVLALTSACGGESRAPSAPNMPAGSIASDGSGSGSLPPLWAPLFVDRKQWTMPLETYHPDQPTRKGTMTCTIDGGPSDHGFTSMLVCRTDGGLYNQSVGRTF